MWDQLAKAAKSLYSAKWWWLLASALAAVVLMHSFAQVQRTLLASAGVHVKELRSEAAYYAANSLSTTLPGGPVLAATFLLRQQRIWGASTLVASWQLVMSGVLQAVGLALLGLGGAFFLGAKNNPLLVAVHPRRLRRVVAAGPGGGVATGTDRRDRVPGVVVGQLSSWSAGRHRPGEVARDALAAGIGQPEPSRLGGGIQLVTGQPVRRCRLPRLRCLRGWVSRVGRRVDGRLCGRPRGRHDTADAWRPVGRGGGAGAWFGVERVAVVRRHFGDVDLPADQLAVARRGRLGGVLLHVPHRERGRSRRLRNRHRRARRETDEAAAMELPTTRQRHNSRTAWGRYPSTRPTPRYKVRCRRRIRPRKPARRQRLASAGALRKTSRATT